MSELRKELEEKYKAAVFDEWEFKDFIDNALSSYVNSTIDTVLNALPKELHNQGLEQPVEDLFYKGYNVAILRVTKILEEAKS